MTCWKALSCSNHDLHLLPVVAVLQLLGACASAPNPAEGPSVSRVKSGVASDSGTKTASLPSVSLSVSPTQISAGQRAVFTATLSKVSSTTIQVSYSMSGTGVRGNNYTITPNQFSVPAGSLSGTVTLTEISTSSSKTAKMTLISGSTYTLSSSIASTLTLKSGSPTPTPTPTPDTDTERGHRHRLQRLERRPHRLPDRRLRWKSGYPFARTVYRALAPQADPYDGSTPARFDNVLYSHRFQNNLSVHLVGAGPFQTDVHHSWFVGPGWNMGGDGIDTTTLQMVGNVAGMRAATCIASDSNIAADYITIHDLTIDCNWSTLSGTADPLHGEKNICTGAISLWGSHALIDHVRAKNGYGSWANAREQFLLYICSPAAADG